MLLRNVATAVGRQRSGRQWVAAVTTFAHLPEVERRLDGLGIPVLALLAEVHLETLQRLAQLPSGTRVGVVAAAVETSHTLEHSITAAALPNIARVETCAAAGLALGRLGRLVRRVDVIVCSTSAAGRVHGLVGATVPVIIDDRALNQRAIQMLGAIVAQHDGGPPTPDARGSPTAVRFALAPRRPREGATPEDGGAVVRQRNDGKRRRRVRGSEGSMAEAGVGDDAR